MEYTSLGGQHRTRGISAWQPSTIVSSAPDEPTAAARLDAEKPRGRADDPTSRPRARTTDRPTARPGTRNEDNVAKRGVKIGIGLMALGAIAAGLSTLHGTPKIGLPVSPPAHAQVAAIVDADTIDVRSNDQLTRIRLGYIATPQPLAPGFPVACLQPQASAQLSSIIPAGTQLTLTYDTDRLGR